MPVEHWHIYLIIACVMLVPGIHVIRFHKDLLVAGLGAKVTSWIFGIAALSGLVVTAYYRFDRNSMGIAAALGMPSLHRLFVRAMFRQFVRRMGREPVDVAFNWAPGLASDRAFAIGVHLGCIFGGLAIVGYFQWGIALTQRGAG